MTRTYLVRGMLVGLLASLVAFGFAKTMGEPQVGKAEAFEEQLAQQRGEPVEKAIVSRSVQDTVGLGTGLVVAGAALGGLFGLAFAIGYRRLPTRTARGTAALLAGLAFTAMYLVPFLKYPANPPSVGNPDTIGRRTALYFVLIACTVLLMIIAGMVYQRLQPRIGTWYATTVAILVFWIAVAVVDIVMPGINEVPAGFPIIVLWRFRLASLGIQLVLWAAIGFLFGAFTERAEAREAEAARSVAVPA
jgi:hypothetical protein